MQSVQIGKNQAGQRLDKFLHKYLPNAGKSFLYKMLRKKNITLNGKKAEGSEILMVGDEVRVFFSEETFAKFSGGSFAGACLDAAAMEDGRLKGGERTGKGAETADLAEECLTAYERLRGISVVYEDADCLILDKPAGILTQKAEKADLSLNEWMIGYLLVRNPAFRKELSTFHPSVCNRLDRNTSGIVLCGKSLAGSQYLSQCIRERKVHKFYMAICAGEFLKEQRVDGYLVKDLVNNVVKVTKIPSGGESEEKSLRISTVYRPVEAVAGYTQLEVELITGKTHQIRGQLASMGFPLVGDRKYGSASENSKLRRKYGLEYHLLHAGRVVFETDAYGIPGQTLPGKRFCAPCPETFIRIGRELGFEKLWNNQNTDM